LDDAGVVDRITPTNRTANRRQRLALRAMYPTCALCEAPFQQCQIHHVAHWRWLQATQFENLVPLCHRHHHLAHEGRWALRLNEDRSLTVTRPDGTVTVHPPPRSPAGPAPQVPP
jgi:hypothetical protein